MKKIVNLRKCNRSSVWKVLECHFSEESAIIIPP